MTGKFEQLSRLRAGEFEHMDGSLIDHLCGTKELLASWSASEVLQDAGLYHAAYGTAGFNESLVSTTRRDEIANVIGKAAEDIVYLYCACDREYFWPQFSASDNPKFKNRFTGQLLLPSNQELCNFCELTVANELEIATDNIEFISTHGRKLYVLFTNMQAYLSPQANSAVEVILGAKSA